MNTAAGPSNFTERTVYVGVLPILLAVGGLVARRPSGAQLFFGALALVTFATAFETGALADLPRAVPGLETINLNRSLILVSFAIAMLAGSGAEILLRGNPREQRRLVVAAGVTAALPVLVILAARFSWLDELRLAVKRLVGIGGPTTGEAIALASVLRWVAIATLAVALLAALVFWARHSRALAWAAVGVVAVDLLVMGWGYNTTIPISEAEPPPPPAIDVMEELTASGGRVAGIGGLEPNTASRWGLRDARGHEQPNVERTESLWFALGGGSDGATPSVMPEHPGTPRLLDVFGVRAALLPPLALSGSEVAFAPLRQDRIAYAESDAVVLYRATALPPAFVAYRWRKSSGLDESLRLMQAGSSRDALNEPVLEISDRPAPGAPARATPARVVERTDTEVTVSVDATAPGQLVLLDTLYPGWEAEVDGEAASVRPANGAFRAVEVDEGRHEVRFAYRPASVLAGGILSGVALVLLLAALLYQPVAARLRRRQDAGTPA